MITSDDPIHSIKHIKEACKKLKKLYEEYHDSNRFLGWNKRKKKFVLKKFK